MVNNPVHGLCVRNDTFLVSTGIPLADQGQSCGNPRSGLKISTIFRGGDICWIAFNLVSDECFITKFC